MPIIAHGPRREYEMEQVLPGDDPGAREDITRRVRLGRDGAVRQRLKTQGEAQAGRRPALVHVGAQAVMRVHCNPCLCLACASAFRSLSLAEAKARQGTG